MSSFSRRDAIRLGVSGAAFAALPRRLLAEWHRALLRDSLKRPYLDAALRAEHWIRSTAITTARGRTWPCTPGDPKRGVPERSLYSGAPGVVLGYLELHSFTGESRFLEEAIAGALELVSLIPATGPVTEAGLYEGLAGHVFVLREVHTASGRDDLHAAALQGARALAAAAEQSATGAGWNDVNDIISGTAGIGLTLLGLRDLLGDEAVALARLAGDRLLAVAKPVQDGQRKWMMDPSFPREMPNFSHGTAGVSYFLATLSQQGGEPRHLEAARDGARYLRAIATPSGEGFVIRHHDGDGAALFYLSWCHGGAGTARLWERLYRIDGDTAWRENENAGARGIIAQGVPEQRTAGFWNNISQCCGNAGVAEYFLTRYARTRNPDDLAYARRHADDLLRRSTEEADAERWIQAENRVSPTEVAAQTGWMQGAAGVAAMLLHLDGAMRGKQVGGVKLPDA
jgi:lantibiotic modifying enzyme